MPARKAVKKAYKKAYKPKGPIVPIYGIPIYDAIKSGDAKQMTSLAAKARKHISEVKTALAALDKQIAKKPR